MIIEIPVWKPVIELRILAGFLFNRSYLSLKVHLECAFRDKCKLDISPVRVDTLKFSFRENSLDQLHLRQYLILVCSSRRECFFAPALRVHGQLCSS